MSRQVLVFLIDALGYEQARDAEFLPSLAAPRAPIETVLGYSSGCIPSLLTGAGPARHGHLSMYRKAPTHGGVFSGIGPWVAAAAKMTGRHWTMRRWISAYLRRRGITGYFSLYDVPLPWLRYFDLCQRKNVYAPQAFSEMPGLPDVLQQHAIPHRIFDWTISEEEAFAGLAAEIRDGNSRVLFFYRPDLDGLMHTVGPRDRRVKEKLDDYSRRIGEMIDTARARHREVEVYVFGDHGMAEVEHTHDVWAALRGLPFAVPGDYLYFLDSTMARFWFRHDEARRSVRRVLAELPYGRILETRELEDLNAFFPQQDYGEMIFLVEEGHLLVPSFMGLTPVRGMHGYHPLAAASYTTLVTNQELAHYPRNLFELHDVLRAAFERAAA